MSEFVTTRLSGLETGDALTEVGEFGFSQALTFRSMQYVANIDSYILHFEETAVSLVAAADITVTVVRPKPRPMVTYYFKNHPNKHEPLVDSSSRFYQNATSIVGDDGVIYKQP